MELKEYIRLELEMLDKGIKRVMDTLNQAEIAWRPACGCNSIGLIIYHLARSNDSFIQENILGKTELWKTGKWYQMLKLPESEAGHSYTAEQVNAFPVPKLENLMAYYDSVQEHTMACLRDMSPGTMDKKLSLPWFGEITVAGIFAILVGHTAQHIGEISYLRGLQHGLDK